MPTSEIYKKSKCCGGCDCDLLDDEEPCWGQVEMASPGDDEDGFPIAGHLCRAHRDAWDLWQTDSKVYYPETEVIA